jgi:hypothetical protein
MPFTWILKTLHKWIHTKSKYYLVTFDGPYIAISYDGEIYGGIMDQSKKPNDWMKYYYTMNFPFGWSIIINDARTCDINKIDETGAISNEWATTHRYNKYIPISAHIKEGLQKQLRKQLHNLNK